MGKEKKTRKYTPNFTVDEWISFRERLNVLHESGKISERDFRILTELIVNMKSTAKLQELAVTDENYSWLQSNQHKPMCIRRIQQILTDNFPEFHIQTTHKSNKPTTKIRSEQLAIRNVMITEDSVCGKCNCKENLELHHMLPVCIGGDNDDRNLIILCHECHQQTTSYFRSLLKQGKIIPNQ